MYLQAVLQLGGGELTMSVHEHKTEPLALKVCVNYDIKSMYVCTHLFKDIHRDPITYQALF